MSAGGLSSRRVRALRAAAEAFSHSGDRRQEADTRFTLGSMLGQADEHHQAVREFDQAAGL
ncbi:MAG TPA: hypothetical protein VFO16_00760 [Pseudonocardiaceae bacterium]|nr:hypothetical protein [Pseudonocardiaceae bacterium]